jgi:enediyne biosynthesis protein E4
MPIHAIFRGRLLLAFPLLLGTALSCSPPPSIRSVGNASGAWFEDVSQRAGIDFLHRTGMKESATILQTNGSGCAFWDFDEDGRMDVVLLNALPRGEGDSTGHRFYHNLGNGRFEDRTESTGIHSRGFGMGLALGDYDGDGHTDLYLTNYGANELWRNLGKGHFEEQAKPAGIALEGWSTGAAFFDADGDGDLDLYVGRYSEFGEGYPQLCGETKARGSCAPRTYPSQPDRFYLNNGKGRFTDATERWGFKDANGRCQGVFIWDFNRDGFPDVFVPNDTTNDYLFLNDGGKRVREIALKAGLAYGPDGSAQASMGVDSCDYDGDGDWDLLVGNFQGEMVALNQQVSPGLFEHVSVAAGVGEPTLRRLTFGLGFLDYDHDGWSDFVLANGHVNTKLETIDPDSPLLQPRQLFRNLGIGTFSEVSSQAGPEFATPRLGRGLAVGDFDDDGKTDILINDNNGRPSLLHNQSPSSGHWLTVALEGPNSNRMAIGATVEVKAGARRMSAAIRSSVSFLSAHDPRPNFGLGSEAEGTVIVIWPDGKKTVRQHVRANQILRVGYGT